MITEIFVADSFDESALRFEGSEAKHVVAFVDKLAASPGSHGVRFEPVREAHDRHMLSARVSRSLRAIAYECAGVLSLLWVDHHDRAYTWARARCVECHPVTGRVVRVYEAERPAE